MTAKPRLEKAHARRLLAQMIRIRAFEEKCAELYTQQKIRGFLHLYTGEEANAVGIMEALSPQDSVVATYREHGHALARGIAMGPLMAEMYGKANGTSRGAEARCTFSTAPPGFAAATPSSAAACRSPSGWPSRRRCRSARLSSSACSARARWRKANSMNCSISRPSGSSPSCSSVRTTCTPWAAPSSAPSPKPTSTAKPRPTASNCTRSTAWTSSPSRRRRGPRSTA